MLPRVKIQYLTGQLGKVADSPDGLVAIVCGGTAVSGGFALNRSYTIRRLAELVNLGVTDANNPRLYKHVSDFYNEAADGTKLVVYGVAKARKLAEICDKDTGELIKLLVAENGALRAVFVAREDDSNVTATEGLDPDVFAALPKAQKVAEHMTTQFFAPLFVVLEGRAYTGANLKTLAAEKYNRVGVLIGDTIPSSKGACIGVLAARVATKPVHRNVGRVKDGSLYPIAAYMGAIKLEEADSLIEDAYDKRYITLRRYVGRSGYFFADDNLACIATDDYAQITARRTVDKAYRIAYDTMLENLLDEMDVNENGTLQAGVAKSIQQTLENAVNRQMTAKGELSAGEDGNGCVCFIDETQNVLSTSRILATLKVRPYGYARYIDVDLGFAVNSNA